MTAMFITVLNMSITASIAALAVMLARVPLKKAPKIFSYVLWAVVLFRLVAPFSIESVFSLMPATSSEVIPRDIIYAPTPAIRTDIPSFDIPINISASNALPPVEAAHIVNPVHAAIGIAAYAWLIGFAALMLYAAAGYVRLKRRVRYATLVRDNIFETDKIQTPFVLGFARPKIYFPLTIDPRKQDYILKHEQTHIKRRDYLIKPLAFAALALHWFNPIVWIAYVLMSRDMEMSCDEAVLRKNDDDIRGLYSASLLNLAVKRTALLSPIAFGESNVNERVLNVLSFKRPKAWVRAVSAVAVSLFLVGFASDGVVNADVLGEINLVATADNRANDARANDSLFNADALAVLESFGVTFDGVAPSEDGRVLMSERQNIYYRGQLARRFSDVGGATWITSYTQGGLIDIHVLRDESGAITGVHVVTRACLHQVQNKLK